MTEHLTLIIWKLHQTKLWLHGNSQNKLVMVTNSQTYLAMVTWKWPKDLAMFTRKWPKDLAMLYGMTKGPSCCMEMTKMITWLHFWLGLFLNILAIIMRERWD